MGGALNTLQAKRNHRAICLANTVSLGHLYPCFRPDESWRPEASRFPHMLSLLTQQKTLVEIPMRQQVRNSH